MTIAFGAGGGVANTITTTLSVAYPAGITAGQLLLLAVVNKYASAPPATPSGWSLIGAATGGSGASGADTGVVNTYVFYQIANGNESGSVAVTITGNNIALGAIYRVTKSASLVWRVSGAGTPKNTGNNATWSVLSSTPLDIRSGDLVYAISGINADAYTFASAALTATGATFSATERQDTVTANGDDCAIHVQEYSCTAGSSSAAPTHQMTATGTLSADAPAGATVFVRLREVALAREGKTWLGVGVGV